MSANGLHICDQKVITRKATSKTIDHVFTNNFDAHINLNYVDYDILDHRMICVELTDTRIQDERVCYTTARKIDFAKLEMMLQKHPIETDASTSVNEMYDKFIEDFKQAR